MSKATQGTIKCIASIFNLYHFLMTRSTEFMAQEVTGQGDELTVLINLSSYVLARQLLKTNIFQLDILTQHLFFLFIFGNSIVNEEK